MRDGLKSLIQLLVGLGVMFFALWWFFIREVPPPVQVAVPANATQEEYGDAWPFTVASGTLACDEPQLVTFTADGTTYALNGAAAGAAAARGWQPDWTAIVRRDSSGDGVSIAPLIEKGLTLCG